MINIFWNDKNHLYASRVNKQKSIFQLHSGVHLQSIDLATDDRHIYIPQ